MFNTDKSRKETLVEYGFRLPSAMDNRPLNFSEFESKIKYGLYISATPCEWEKQKSNNVIVEQIVRPTGLLDPTIVIKPSKNQVDDLINELIDQNKKNQRTFITVLTIKMAENLTEFLNSKGIKCAYMHSELKTLDRSVIINDLRKGKYDAIVGINLLREGLDVPEVSLVAIFDADKPGFFRNERSLIQIFGRAARNLNGRIIMYADTITKDMQSAINETDRRRKIQSDYNKKNNITPTTIIKSIHENISSNKEEKIIEQTFEYKKKILHEKNKSKAISILKKEMLLASNKQDYEKAMYLRDMIIDLESKIK
ncbi:hypothetical protein FACS189459_0950 [Bacilli bacterium]|nr:hypothetical protein FACS189459_0950 [Bacilli bacterium]